MPKSETTVMVARYLVNGELFFASSNDLTTQFEYTQFEYAQFEYAADPANMVIDMYGSHVWDASTVAALDGISYRYERHGKTATFTGMNVASTAMHTRLAGNLGGGH